jgi:hypothetical protein
VGRQVVRLGLGVWVVRGLLVSQDLTRSVLPTGATLPIPGQRARTDSLDPIVLGLDRQIQAETRDLAMPWVRSWIH